MKSKTIKFSKLIRVLSTMFFLSTSACGLIGGDGSGGGSYSGLGFPSVKATIERYSTCEEIQEAIDVAAEKKKQDYERYRLFIESQQRDSIAVGGGVAVPLNSEDASGGVSESGDEFTTNRQEAGIDESDTIKINSDFIFVSKFGKIVVTNRLDLQTLGEVDVQEIAEFKDPELFLTSDKLIVIADLLGETVIETYTLQAGTLPTKVSRQFFSGKFETARLSANRLLLLTKAAIETPALDAVGGYHGGGFAEQALDSAPGFYGYSVPKLTFKNGKLGDISCNSVVKKSVQDFDFNLVNIHSIDFTKTDLLEGISSISLVGGGNQFYVSKESIYVSKSGVNWIPWYTPNQSDFEKEELIIKKVGFDDSSGELKMSAVGSVRGVGLSQWAFKHLASTDALAVTTSTRFDRKNHLWTLKQNGENLENIGAINDFAPNEDVRSVRYVGDMAYVVTFLQIDPLFAFDLSDPFSPKEMGELKIPGFSTYLHPTSDGKLIGVGHTGRSDRVKISLFDVVDPTNMSQVDSHIFGNGVSFSEATSNHHAFFYDDALKRLAIPITEKRNFGSTPIFSGVSFQKIEAGGFNEEARLSHQSWIPAECSAEQQNYFGWGGRFDSLDINRVFQIGDVIYTISRFGVKTYSTVDLSPGPEKEFSPGTQECGFREPYYYF